MTTISAISLPVASTVNTASQGNAPVVAAPSPACSDPLDFATIDSAEKALALPALNSLAFASFASVITACAMSNCGLHGSLAMAIGQGTQQMKLDGQYKLSFGADSSISLGCSGKAGQADFNETWTYGLDESIKMQGKFGNSEEALVMIPDNKGSAHLAGHIGSVAIDLTYTEKGYDGTVGGKAVHCTSEMKPVDGALYGVDASGSLDGGAFNFSGQATRSADGKGIATSGKGVVGSYQVSLDQTLIPELPNKF